MATSGWSGSTSTGTIRWQVLLGGDGGETGSSVRQTADGGYVLFGFSDSSESGDVTGATHGSYDYWVVKLEGDVPIVTVPGGVEVPRDLNADGKYDDVNGNGRKDFADVVLYFNQMTWIAANEPVSAFDYNGTAGSTSPTSSGSSTTSDLISHATIPRVFIIPIAKSSAWNRRIVRAAVLPVAAALLVVALGAGTVSALDWQNETVEYAAPWGGSASLALDWRRQPRISYYRLTVAT